MDKNSDSIGTATISPDGIIGLHLRAETDGTLGDAYIEYRPDNPQYEAIKQHLGGIKPGEEKFVAPWPSDNSE